MELRYFLKYYDETIGYFIVSNQKKYFSTENAKNIPYGHGFPLGLYPLDKSKKGIIFPLINYTPSEEDIYHWINDRVFPKNRDGAYQLLESIGLSSYDAWDIFIYTKGMTFLDFYWITRDENEKYQDNHIRAFANKLKFNDGEDDEF